MRISILLFGPQATIAGNREVQVDVAADPPTAGAVLAALEESEPKLASSLRTSRLAVNHEFADQTQTIGPEDEVALIGMVSGG